ncbi:MAG: polysaccharide biosynthesis protein [Thermoleophilia bacterium]
MISFRQIRLRPLAMFVDACIVVNAYTLASLVLFAQWAPLQYYNELLKFLPIALIIHSALNLKLGLYRGVGRYAGLHQGIRIIRAAAISMPLLLVAGVIIMPSSYLHVLAMVPIGGVIAFILMAGVRFYPRVFYERSLREITASQKVMIVGAGAAGEMILRSIQTERQLAMEVVALIDDNPRLHDLEIHEVTIFGPAESIPEIVKEKEIDEIIITIPSASLEQFQRIWKICSRTGVVTKTLRPIQSTRRGEVGVSNIREIEIEDVLGRQPVLTDYSQIRDFIRDKVVLITGAGGSIGSELALQISHHNPTKVVLVDRDESALYQIHEKLSRKLFYNHELCVADVQSEDAVEAVFRKHRPELVFHAAAYKHVPLMELHPGEAVLNNVMGTWIVASLAGVYGAGSFVNISTDKAVEPVNVMGATKQLGELLVKELGSVYPQTRYCSVRFGNVLGSRGSVIPIFQEQIINGGPITITHPEMTRYFMLICEAVDLVLQAAAFPDGNSIYVLEMGQPVQIMELARQMVAFMSPDKQIETTFTGLRPGEKLHEQLLDKNESRAATGHPMIYRVSRPALTNVSVLGEIPRLFDAARERRTHLLLDQMQNLMASYSPFDMGLVGSMNLESRSQDTAILEETSSKSRGINYRWVQNEADSD